jgi:ATP-dependent exoDNAse (exonuclease V) beta subunit
VNENKKQIISIEASAGAGKTYSLAKRYISLLFEPSGQTRVKNIIAVTFANKAALEMKSRVIYYLKKAALSLDTENIFEGLNLSKSAIKEKSVKILDEILENYDDFNISTIDSFKNRILKACAINLGLSPNFKIEDDYSQNLMFALDSFIETALKSSKTRALLESYIKQYLLVEKSGWFPKNDIFKEASKVFNKSSNSGKNISYLKNDFQKELYKRSGEIYDKILLFKEKFTKLKIHSQYVKDVEKIVSGGRELGISRLCKIDIPAKFANSEIKYLKDAEINFEANALWEEISAQISELCAFYAKNYYSVYCEIYEDVSKEFDLRAKKDELVFLNEINKKTFSLFKDPAFTLPEIYYRLSEKYKHFLIDEFQDTNSVQWSGIKRFLEESLSNGGTFFYVGDAKQAIYDFRGGNSSIFYKAVNEFSSFSAAVVFLNQNYRSHLEIVNFNNKIFSSENLTRFADEINKDGRDYGDIARIYSSSKQAHKPEKDKGYVEIEIMPKDASDSAAKEKFNAFLDEILTRFNQKDIAVLCRTNAQTLTAGSWILERGLNVNSPQTLSLKNNNIIKQIFSFMEFIASPTDSLSFASFITGDIFLKTTDMLSDEILNFLFLHNKTASCETFYIDFRNSYKNIWDEYFESFFVKSGFVPVYELLISILEKFKIVENFPPSKAFVMRFLELIKDFENETQLCGLKTFSDYFKSLRDDDPSLFVINSSKDAITVTTVHKAKGLQFPVAIIPFLALASSKTENPFFMEEQNSLKLVYLSKDAAKFSPELKGVYDDEKAEFLLAELNVLYVAMTRAECEIYAIAAQKAGASNNAAIALLGGKNIKAGTKENYALKKDEDSRCVKDVCLSGYRDVLKNFASPDIEISEFNENKKKGNILHFALSNVVSLLGKDISFEIDAAIAAAKNKFALQDVTWLKEELAALFENGEILKLFLYKEDEISNEREVIGENGVSLRIDKLIVLPDEIIIADFKSSLFAKEEKFKQVRNYAEVVSRIYPDKKIGAYIADIGAREVLSVI